MVKTKDVPKQWCEQTQGAKNVADELAEAYQSRPEVARIVVSKSEEGIDGLHGFKVVVSLSDMDVAEEFPAEKDGVEVEVRKAKPGLST